MRFGNSRCTRGRFGAQPRRQSRENSGPSLFSTIAARVNQNDAARTTQRSKQQHGILTSLPDKTFSCNREDIRAQRTKRVQALRPTAAIELFARNVIYARAGKFLQQPTASMLGVSAERQQNYLHEN